MIAGARVPFELDVDHFGLALFVRLDHVAADELAGGLEAMFLLATTEERNAERGNDPKLVLLEHPTRGDASTLGRLSFALSMLDDAAMRFRSMCFGVLCSLGLLSQPGYAQSAPSALSLGQAVERFRRENLKLAAAKYQVSAARADIIAAGLLPNPRLGLGASFRVHGEPQGADREYSAMLAQTLPIWGRLGASRDAAQLAANAAEREYAAAGWQSIGELKLAYLDLQVTEQQRVVLAAGLTDLERVQRVLDARAAAGANPQYDRVRLEVERGNLRARVALAEVAVLEARAALAATIGGAPSATELGAADALAEPNGDPRALTELARLAFEHRHEIAASRLQAGAAEARVRAVRKRFLPEPELGVGYARWSGIPGFPSSTVGGALQVSASIPLPIFDRGQGTVQRQLEESSAAHVREHDVKNSIEREVALAARKVQLTSTAYRSYREQAAQQAESVRRIAEVTYREGRGTILELLDAYSSYLRVEEQALALRGAALASLVELEQAIGPTQ